MNYGNYQEIANANTADIKRLSKNLKHESDALRAIDEVAKENRMQGRLRRPWFGSRTTEVTR